MPNGQWMRSSRILAGAALIGVAITLSACVSDRSPIGLAAPNTANQAAATAALVPTAVPTMAPIQRNQTAAIVQGTPISGAEYADVADQQRKAAAVQAAQQQQAPPSEVTIRAGALSHLIQRTVIAIYAAHHHLTVTPAEIQTLYTRYEVNNGGPITFTRTLMQFGYTPVTFKSALSDSLLLRKVAQLVAPLPTVVKAERVRARHILVKTQAEADRLYAQLVKDPSQFAVLAQRYSIDTGSGKLGGELGFFSHGQMVPPFEKAAFSQRVGEIGKPVKSQFGYHIIQVEQHTYSTPYAQLDQQTQQTYQQQQQAAFARWYQAEKKADHVQVLVKGLPPLQ